MPSLYASLPPPNHTHRILAALRLTTAHTLRPCICSSGTNLRSPEMTWRVPRSGPKSICSTYRASGGRRGEVCEGVVEGWTLKHGGDVANHRLVPVSQCHTPQSLPRLRPGAACTPRWSPRGCPAERRRGPTRHRISHRMQGPWRQRRIWHRKDPWQSWHRRRPVTRDVSSEAGGTRRANHSHR